MEPNVGWYRTEIVLKDGNILQFWVGMKKDHSWLGVKDFCLFCRLKYWLRGIHRGKQEVYYETYLGEPDNELSPHATPEIDPKAETEVGR